jgi:outer membrane protein assembly factor BamB
MPAAMRVAGLFVALLCRRSAVAVDPPIPVVPISISTTDADDVQPDQAASPTDDLQRLVTDRRVVRQLTELRGALRRASGSQQEPAALRDLLTQLRASDPGILVPAEGLTFVPLHRAVAELLAEPGATERLDVRADEEAAAKALTKLLAAREPDELPALLHRYAGATAAWLAHLLLAAQHVDRGETLAARFWLLPLMRAGVPAAFRQTARDMDARLQALEASSNVAAAGGAPPRSSGSVAFLRWTTGLPLARGDQAATTTLVQGGAATKLVPWSAWEPVLDDTAMFARTSLAIVAVDLATGRQLWVRQPAVPPESEAESLLDSRRQRDAQSEATISLLQATVLHRDEIGGRMSLDSERLYAVVPVTDPETIPATAQRPARIPGRRPASAAALELLALDRHSGRRVWSVGGASLESRHGNELAGTWFAGPPAVTGTDLLVVGERDGAIHLLCLAAATGRRLWALPLVLPEVPIARDPARQLLSSQLHIDGGLVYFTTSNGWACAVDVMTRSPVWVRRLPQTAAVLSAPATSRGSAFLLQRMLPMSLAWRSEPPRRAGDALLLASALGHELVSVGLLDGRLRARTDAAGSTLVVHVDAQRVVVASPSAVFALQPEDLQPKWSAAVPEGRVPVGRGAIHDGQLLVPLSDGGVWPLDLDNGASREPWPLLRRPCSSGGLFVAHNRLLSFAPDQLSASPLPLAHSGSGQQVDPLAAASRDNPLSNDLASNTAKGRGTNTEASRAPAVDPLTRADLLMRNGQFAAALHVLDSMEVEPLNREDLCRLKFQTLLLQTLHDWPVAEVTSPVAEAATAARPVQTAEVARAGAGAGISDQDPDDKPAHALQRLQELRHDRASTCEERATIRLLTVRGSQTPHDVGAVFEQLAADANELSVLLPEPERMPELLAGTLCLPQTTSQPELLVRRSLRLHLVNTLRECLNDPAVAASADVAAGLSRCDDLTVRLLGHPAAADECLARADRLLGNAPRSEQLLHLLVAAQATGSASVLADVQARLVQLRQRLEAQNPAATGEYDVAIELVDTLLAGLREEPTTADAESAGADIPSIVEEQVEAAWKDPASVAAEDAADGTLKCRVVPVSTVSQMPLQNYRDMPVSLVDPDDAFLSRFDWSLQSQPLALVARRRGAGGAAVLSLALPGHGLHNGGGERLSRFGSVLVLQTESQLTAFSLLEARWLWTRRLTSTTSRFTPELAGALPAGADGVLRAWWNPHVAGGSPRHLAVRSGSQIVLLDLLTGRPLWDVTPGDPAAQAYCRDRFLLVSRADRIGWAVFDPRDGALLPKSNEVPPVNSPDVVDPKDVPLPARTLAVTADAVLTWSATKRAGPAALEWRDPVTFEVRHTQELDDLKFLAPMGSGTLLGISGEGRIEEISLDSRSRRVFAATAPVGDRSQNTEPGRRTDFIVRRDAEHYYLLQAKPAVEPPLPLGFGIVPQAVTGSIRAISRRTGELVWERDAPADAAVLPDMSGDRFLLLLEVPRSAAADLPVRAVGLLPPRQSVTVIGWWRESGNEAFRHPVITRAPIPTLRTLSAGADAWTLEAFGNRARLVKAELATAVPQQASH